MSLYSFVARSFAALSMRKHLAVSSLYIFSILLSSSILFFSTFHLSAATVRVFAVVAETMTSSMLYELVFVFVYLESRRGREVLATVFKLGLSGGFELRAMLFKLGLLLNFPFILETPVLVCRLLLSVYRNPCAMSILLRRLVHAGLITPTAITLAHWYTQDAQRL
jgi:hypothetical protein